MKLGLIYGPTSISGSDVNFFIDKILKLKKRRDLDIIVCPEFALEGSHPYNETEARAILSTIKKEGNLKNKLILPGTYLYSKGNLMFNVLPIFLNGNVLFYHKKTTNDEEALASKYKLKYITGGGSSARFVFMNRVIGVEICRDNPMQRLKKEGLVNLQILVDCGCQYPKSNALISGGHFVICSGFKGSWEKPYAQVLNSNGKSLAYEKEKGILEYEIK